MTDGAASLDCPICGNVIPVDGSACKVCGHVVGGESPSTSDFAWGTPDPEPPVDGVDPSWAPPTVPPSSPTDATNDPNDWPTPAAAPVTPAALGPDPSPTADPFDPAWAPPESTSPDPGPVGGSPLVDPPLASTPLPADTADPFAAAAPPSPSPSPGPDSGSGLGSARPGNPPPMPAGPPTTSDPLSRFGPPDDAATADPFTPTPSPDTADPFTPTPKPDTPDPFTPAKTSDNPDPFTPAADPDNNDPFGPAGTPDNGRRPTFEGSATTNDPFAPTVSPSFLDRGARSGRTAPPDVEVGTAATVTADGMLFDRSTEAGPGPVIGDRPATGPYGPQGRQQGRPQQGDGSNRRTIALGLIAVVLLGVAGWFGGRYLRGADDAGDGTALEAAADPTDSADGGTDVDPGGPTSDPSNPNDEATGSVGSTGLDDEPVDGSEDDGTDTMADDPNAEPGDEESGTGDGSGSDTPTDDGSGTDEGTAGGDDSPAAIPADPDVLFTDRDTLYGSYVAVLWSAVAGGGTGSESIVQQRRTESTNRFGENVHAVDSDGFRSLRDGTVAVVYAGGFTSALDAKQWCRTSGFSGVDDCFGVVLSDDFGPGDRGELSRVYSLDG